MQKQQINTVVDAHWQQTDRLATIGTLAAGIAHELNNPIGYILSNLTSFQLYLPIFVQYFDLLQALAQCDDKAQKATLQQQLATLQQQENLQFLLQDTESLLHDSLQGALLVRNLVLDLRRFSHPDHEEFQRLELRPLMEMALRLCKNELKNHIATDCVIEPATIWLQGQPAALTQVLVNLLLNAAQAIGQESGQIRLTAVQQNGWLELCVADSGPGIAEQILPQIFEPFFTTKAAGKGTGLGLSICRSIVQQHGGAISVGPSVLGGAAFTLHLPAETFESAGHGDPR